MHALLDVAVSNAIGAFQAGHKGTLDGSAGQQQTKQLALVEVKQRHEGAGSPVLQRCLSRQFWCAFNVAGDVGAEVGCNDGSARGCRIGMSLAALVELQSNRASSPYFVVVGAVTYIQVHQHHEATTEHPQSPSSHRSSSPLAQRQLHATPSDPTRLRHGKLAPLYIRTTPLN